jgi:hypothetical protein
MTLSANLVDTLGFMKALEIYIGDYTYSSFAVLCAGGICQICPTFVSIKNRALMVSKGFGAHPVTRYGGAVKPPLDLMRFFRESQGMALDSKTGSLFAAVKNPKIKSKKKKAADHEDALTGSEREGARTVGRPTAARKKMTKAMDEEMTTAADQLSKFFDKFDSKLVSGGEGVDNVPKEQQSQIPSAKKVSPKAMGKRSRPARAEQQWGQDGDAYDDAWTPGPASGHNDASALRCMGCGSATASGRWSWENGGSEYYCSLCWQAWQGGAYSEQPTDIGTDLTDIGSGTDATYIDNGYVSVSDNDW